MKDEEEGPEEIEDENIRRRCLLKVDDNAKIRWDIFIILLATWNCFQIPFTLAFMPDLDKEVYWKVINTIIDI